MHQRDKEMKRMRMGIEQIESRNQKLDLLERNNQKLVQTLENLFKAISIDQESMLVLQNPDFRSPKGLKAAVTASQLLLHHLDSNSTIFADLNDMLCVKEKRVMLEALGTNFCNIAFEFLESLFTSFSKELSETASLDTRSFSTAVSFQSHEETHSLLQRYLSLCLQLQRMAEVRFESFRNHYTSNFRICYEKQIKSYFNGLKKVILKDKIDRKMVSMPTFELSPRLSNFKLSEKDLAQRRSSSFSPQWSTTSNKVLLDKILVHDAFALTLNSLARVIMEEWSFCYEMFAIHVDNAEDLKLSDKNGSSGFEDEVDLERREIENREVMKNRADINSMVEKLFKGVDAELLDLVDLASSIDQFSTIRMIIQTKKTHDKFAGQCDYLSGLLIGIQDKLHSNFKNYINEQAQWIESLSSTAKKLQVGIPIQKFPTFVLQVERVIEESSSGVSSRGLKKVSEASDSERESSELGNSSNSLIVRDPIIEKSYHRLISSIFKWIEGIASQDPKYQSVVLTTNFFQFWSTFSSLEVDFPGMQDHIQHAYSYYMDHQERYIKWHIEYEMPDVIQFWDLLDNQLAAVSSSADIPFTPCLSRQDLRLLCSRRLDLKPLTSSISNLYSRVTKHFKLSRDLASRIWLSTRDHFQARYQRFEQLVTDCYRNETVSVSSSDVAALFSSQFPDDHPHPSTD